LNCEIQTANSDSACYVCFTNCVPDIDMNSRLFMV